MKKIENLTPEQEIKLVEYYDAALKAGLRIGHDEDCERIGRDAIVRAYADIGRDPPKEILWARSPKDAIDMAIAMSGMDNSQASRSSIFDQRWCFGQCELYWIAWARFAESIGVVFTEDQLRRLDIMERLAHACFMAFSWEHVTILVRHPEHISFDERTPQLLHDEKGMALCWSDGYGISSWHGTQVPHEWISDRENLDPGVALTEQNIERRRAAAEIIGWAKILATVQHRVIDEDPDPEIGTLLSVDLPDAPDSRFLKVLCGTRRTFVLPVPQDCKTALEANAWTYDIEPLDLRSLEVRT